MGPGDYCRRSKINPQGNCTYALCCSTQNIIHTFEMGNNTTVKTVYISMLTVMVEVYAFCYWLRIAIVREVKGGLTYCSRLVKRTFCFADFFAASAQPFIHLKHPSFLQNRNYYQIVFSVIGLSTQ